MIRLIPVFFFLAWVGISYRIHYEQGLEFPSLYNGWFEPCLFGFMFSLILTIVVTAMISLFLYGSYFFK